MNLTTNEQQVDTESIDIINANINDILSYWRLHGWHDHTLFSPVFREENGTFSTITTTIPGYTSKCRDVLTCAYFISVYGKRTASFTDAAPGTTMRMNFERIIDRGANHQKLMVVFTNGLSNNIRVNHTIALLNALEEYMDNVFEGQRSFITYTNYSSSFVFNIPNKWCTTLVMVSLYSFIIRYCYSIPTSYDPGILLNWFLTSDGMSTPSFSSDATYILKARKIIQALITHGLHEDRLNYFNGNKNIPYNTNHGIHNADIHSFDPSQTLPEEAYVPWSRVKLID